MLLLFTCAKTYKYNIWIFNSILNVWWWILGTFVTILTAGSIGGIYCHFTEALPGGGYKPWISIWGIISKQLSCVVSHRSYNLKSSHSYFLNLCTEVCKQLWFIIKFPYFSYCVETLQWTTFPHFDWQKSIVLKTYFSTCIQNKAKHLYMHMMYYKISAMWRIYKLKKN